MSVINPRLPISKCQWVGSCPVMVFLALFIWCPRKALNYYQLVTQSLGLRLFWRKKCTFHSQGYWSSLGSLKILDTLFVVPFLPFFLVCLLGWPKISQTMVSTKNVSQLFIIIHKSNAWCLNCKNHDFCAFTSLSGSGSDCEKCPNSSWLLNLAKCPIKITEFFR